MSWSTRTPHPQYSHHLNWPLGSQPSQSQTPTEARMLGPNAGSRKITAPEISQKEQDKDFKRTPQC